MSSAAGSGRGSRGGGGGGGGGPAKVTKYRAWPSTDPMMRCDENRLAKAVGDDAKQYAFFYANSVMNNANGAGFMDHKDNNAMADLFVVLLRVFLANHYRRGVINGDRSNTSQTLMTMSEVINPANKRRVGFMFLMWEKNAFVMVAPPPGPAADAAALAEAKMGVVQREAVDRTNRRRLPFDRWAAKVFIEPGTPKLVELAHKNTLTPNAQNLDKFDLADWAPLCDAFENWLRASCVYAAMAQSGNGFRYNDDAAFHAITNSSFGDDTWAFGPTKIFSVEHAVRHMMLYVTESVYDSTTGERKLGYDNFMKRWTYTGGPSYHAMRASGRALAANAHMSLEFGQMLGAGRTWIVPAWLAHPREFTQYQFPVLKTDTVFDTSNPTWRHLMHMNGAGTDMSHPAHQMYMNILHAVAPVSANFDTISEGLRVRAADIARIPDRTERMRQQSALADQFKSFWNASNIGGGPLQYHIKASADIRETPEAFSLIGMSPLSNPLLSFTDSFVSLFMTLADQFGVIRHQKMVPFVGFTIADAARRGKSETAVRCVVQIEGPPGTGKSVLLAAIRSILPKYAFVNAAHDSEKTSISLGHYRVHITFIDDVRPESIGIAPPVPGKTQARSTKGMIYDRKNFDPNQNAAHGFGVQQDKISGTGSSKTIRTATIENGHRTVVEETFMHYGTTIKNVNPYRADMDYALFTRALHLTSYMPKDGHLGMPPLEDIEAANDMQKQRFVQFWTKMMCLVVEYNCQVEAGVMRDVDLTIPTGILAVLVQSLRAMGYAGRDSESMRKREQLCVIARSAAIIGAIYNVFGDAGINAPPANEKYEHRHLQYLMPYMYASRGGAFYVAETPNQFYDEELVSVVCALNRIVIRWMASAAAGGGGGGGGSGSRVPVSPAHVSEPAPAGASASDRDFKRQFDEFNRSLGAFVPQEMKDLFMRGNGGGGSGGGGAGEARNEPEDIDGDDFGDGGGPGSQFGRNGGGGGGVRNRYAAAAAAAGMSFAAAAAAAARPRPQVDTPIPDPEHYRCAKGFFSGQKYGYGTSPPEENYLALLYPIIEQELELAIPKQAVINALVDLVKPIKYPNGDVRKPLLFRGDDLYVYESYLEMMSQGAIYPTLQALFSKSEPTIYHRHAPHRDAHMTEVHERPAIGVVGGGALGGMSYETHTQWNARSDAERAHDPDAFTSLVSRRVQSMELTTKIMNSKRNDDEYLVRQFRQGFITAQQYMEQSRTGATSKKTDIDTKNLTDYPVALSLAMKCAEKLSHVPYYHSLPENNLRLKQAHDNFHTKMLDLAQTLVQVHSSDESVGVAEFAMAWVEVAVAFARRCGAYRTYYGFNGAVTEEVLTRYLKANGCIPLVPMASRGIAAGSPCDPEKFRRLVLFMSKYAQCFVTFVDAMREGQTEGPIGEAAEAQLRDSIRALDSMYGVLIAFWDNYSPGEIGNTEFQGTEAQRLHTENTPLHVYQFFRDEAEEYDRRMSGKTGPAKPPLQRLVRRSISVVGGAAAAAAARGGRMDSKHAAAAEPAAGLVTPLRPARLAAPSPSPLRPPAPSPARASAPGPSVPRPSPVRTAAVPAVVPRTPVRTPPRPSQPRPSPPPPPSAPSPQPAPRPAAVAAAPAEPMSYAAIDAFLAELDAADTVTAVRPRAAAAAAAAPSEPVPAPTAAPAAPAAGAASFANFRRNPNIPSAPVPIELPDAVAVSAAPADPFAALWGEPPSTETDADPPHATGGVKRKDPSPMRDNVGHGADDEYDDQADAESKKTKKRQKRQSGSYVDEEAEESDQDARVSGDEQSDDELEEGERRDAHGYAERPDEKAEPERVLRRNASHVIANQDIDADVAAAEAEVERIHANGRSRSGRVEAAAAAAAAAPVPAAAAAAAPAIAAPGEEPMEYETTDGLPVSDDAEVDDPRLAVVEAVPKRGRLQKWAGSEPTSPVVSAAAAVEAMPSPKRMPAAAAAAAAASAAEAPVAMVDDQATQPPSE